MVSVSKLPMQKPRKLPTAYCSRFISSHKLAENLDCLYGFIIIDTTDARASYQQFTYLEHITHCNN